MTDELFLVDLSSIAHPIFHQSTAAPHTTSTQIVDRVRALTSDHPHAAICCDSGRSFRYDIDKSYKAHRPESDATLQHEIARSREQLVRDGYPVWAVPECEADDLIASATKLALAIDGTRVLIASADKDLLQLVGDRVEVKSLKDGTRIDATRVWEKFGVTPAQMRDYLTLVGDSSDNIKGAFKIGPKKAVDLLTRFGSIEGIYAALDTPVPGEMKFAHQTAESLEEFRTRWETVRQLVTLRDDVPLPFAEVAAERTPTDSDEQYYDATEEEEPVSDATPTEPTPPPAAAAPPPSAEPPPAMDPPPMKESLVEVLPAPAPGDWTKQLEPRSMTDAWRLSSAMHKARLFSGYGTPEAVLSTVLAGRELGFNAIASLRAFHIIDGKHSLAADAMRGLVLRSGAAKYFRIVERTAEHCTWETWRQGDPEPIRLTYTIAQSRAAWQKDERAWNNGPYTKNPEDMLSARASSKLARLVYADILFALYAPSELSDDRMD